jgi:hypothetical protein
MIGFQGEKEFYMQMQEHLFEMIPESWKKILLHTSIIDIPNQKAKGQMYIYYLPKGILKRKPVNCYEIPALFDIDEEEYSRLITNLYNIIKLSRDNYKKYKKEVWSTIDITCTNNEFIVKYGFENLEHSEYTPEEKHIIWRYENLNIDLDSLTRKERKILDYYIKNSKVSIEPYVEICQTEIYERPSKAFVDYERSLTLDEIIARNQEAERQEEKRQKKIAKQKRKKQLDILEESDTEPIITNQILKQ